MSKSKFLDEKRAELKKELEVIENSQSEEEYFKKRSENTVGKRRQQMIDAKNQAFDTVALWGLYGKEDIRAGA